MKNFYKTPETKEEALASLNEMNEISPTRRAGKMLEIGINKFGITQQNINEYQQLVMEWVERVARQNGCVGKTEVMKFAEETLNGWGYETYIQNPDQPAFKRVIVK